MANPKPQASNPPDVAPPRPTFSHVVTYSIPPNSASKIIAVAGQVGQLPNGEVPPDFATQVRTALSNLTKCIESVGATQRDIMKVTQYVVDFDEKTRAPASFYLEWIGEYKPASTLIPVTKLAAPALLYEIEALVIVSG